MGLFTKIFQSVTLTGFFKQYGTREDWKRANKVEKKRFEENIKNGISAGEIPRTMLGRFYFTCDRAEEGEKILYQAVQDGDKDAASDYFHSVSYYFMQESKYNRRARSHKWFQRWIDAGEQCVLEGDKDAETSLADAYNACYGIKDPEFEQIVDRIVELYEIATAKHQSSGAMNYAQFIVKRLSTEEYKKINPEKYRNREEAEPIFLQAVKDEKSTQFYQSALESTTSFYTGNIFRIGMKALDLFLEGQNIEVLVNDAKENYDKAMRYARMLNNEEAKFEEINDLNQELMLFELLVLCQKLRNESKLNEELLAVVHNYVYQISPKKTPNAKITMEWEESIDRLSQYYLDNKEVLHRNGIKLSTGAEDFLVKRIERRKAVSNK